MYGFLKALTYLLAAGILAAVATLFGCSFDPASGATGNLDLQTPFGSLKGDFKIVPGILTAPPAPAPIIDPFRVIPAPEQTATEPTARITWNF